MKKFIFLLLVLAGCIPQSAPEAAPSEEEEVVLALVAAFNAHDAELMGQYVAEDVIWVGIGERDATYIEAEGREALIAGMKGYFEALPTVRSDIESRVTTGPYVAYRERVFWQGEDGEETQAALGVYEVKDGAVHRVWYYPAVP